MDVTLYGTQDSVYTRIVRLALLEKQIDFVLLEADPFEGGILPDDYFIRHPFKRIPAIEVNGTRLYETDAIVHYIDTLAQNSPLVPSDAQDAARMRQIMRIVDNYLYQPLVWGIYVSIWWRDGLKPTADAVEKSRQALTTLEGFFDESPKACFNNKTLASLYLASMLAAGDSVAVGTALIDEQPRLRRWWDTIRDDAIMVKTRSIQTKF